MKINRLVMILCLMMVSVFTKIVAVYATENFPSSIIISSEGVSLTLDSNLNVSNSISKENASYTYFHVKNSNIGQIYCTSGFIDPPIPDVKCNISSFDNINQEKGVAYIINLINKTSASDNEKYWWSEFLINSYLNRYGYQTNTSTYKNIINGNHTILNTGKTYAQIMIEANEAANKEYKNIDLLIDLSTVFFTKNEDGNYYSNPVKITSNGNFEISVSNDKFSYDETENGYIFKIKDADVLPGSLQSFTATITSTETASTYYIAKNYDCGLNYQHVTPLTIKEVKTTIPDPVIVSGSVEKNATVTKISKVSVTDGKELPGATLEIQDEQGNIVKYCKAEDGTENSDCKWVSTNKPYEIIGLPVGKYYLVETIAPEGYELSKEKIMFEVKGDGTVTEVKMENNIEVVVPSTLSGKSALLLTIAMFDIALGIGIITYVKKNKIEQ